MKATPKKKKEKNQAKIRRKTMNSIEMEWKNHTHEEKEKKKTLRFEPENGFEMASAISTPTSSRCVRQRTHVLRTIKTAKIWRKCNKTADERQRFTFFNQYFSFYNILFYSFVRHRRP